MHRLNVHGFSVTSYHAIVGSVQHHPLERLFMGFKDFSISKRSKDFIHFLSYSLASVISHGSSIACVYDWSSHIYNYLQKKNPMEEINEKLKQQENELHFLRELIVKGFENLPVQLSKASQLKIVKYVVKRLNYHKIVLCMGQFYS